MKYLAPFLLVLSLLTMAAQSGQLGPQQIFAEPYVCTPSQAEAGECLPIVRK